MKTLSLVLTKELFNSVQKTVSVDLMSKLVDGINEVSLPLANGDIGECVEIELAFSVSTVKQMHEAVSMLLPNYTLSYHTFRNKYLKALSQLDKLDRTQIYKSMTSVVVSTGATLAIISKPHIKDLAKSDEKINELLTQVQNAD